MMFASKGLAFKQSLKALLLVSLLFLPVLSQAKIEAYSFDEPQQEETYKKLIAELRCLVCQNQNLADSNAELAQDMRRKTYEMVRDGKDADEIVDFMVTRYGDFVMYRPPLKSTTFFLWFGPLIIFILAAIIVGVFVRKQKQQPVAEVAADQKQRAHSILDEE